jgi:hypothetical protein
METLGAAVGDLQVKVRILLIAILITLALRRRGEFGKGFLGKVELLSRHR